MKYIKIYLYVNVNKILRNLNLSQRVQRFFQNSVDRHANSLTHAQTSLFIIIDMYNENERLIKI